MKDHDRLTQSRHAPAHVCAHAHTAHVSTQMADMMGLSEAYSNPMAASKLAQQDNSAIERERQQAERRG